MPKRHGISKARTQRMPPGVVRCFNLVDREQLARECIGWAHVISSRGTLDRRTRQAAKAFLMRVSLELTIDQHALDRLSLRSGSSE